MAEESDEQGVVMRVVQPDMPEQLVAALKGGAAARADARHRLE